MRSILHSAHVTSSILAGNIILHIISLKFWPLQEAPPAQCQDGYLQFIIHALINAMCIWLIYLLYIPSIWSMYILGVIYSWVLCKHEGNYMQVKIELVLFNNPSYQMILIICSRNKNCMHPSMQVCHEYMTVFGRWPCWSQ